MSIVNMALWQNELLSGISHPPESAEFSVWGPCILVASS